jgi:uncharacterized SAM-binding protein YcdF (DUF218 family)
LTKKELTEIDYALLFLLQNGVPDENIILEKSSRNTFENAKYTSEILSQKFPNGKAAFLLISSSYQLKRALACFENQGIQMDYFATNPITTHQPFDIIDFIPTSSAKNQSELLLKELTGFFIYKIMGYA